MATRIILGILTLCWAGLSQAYIVDGSRINQPRLLSYAKNKLQNQGVLQQTSQGFTYVKLPDKYVAELISQFGRPGFDIPRDIPSNTITGAHISVIQENEAQKIISLKELGQTVSFNPLGFYTVIQHDKEYLMLAVDAPELSSLRQKYGLTEKLENHEFKIMIGVRQLVAENELVSEAEIR